MGRPAGSTNAHADAGRIAARKHAEKAMDALVKLLEGPFAELRFKAAESILDRAYGKPAQTTALTGADGGPVVFEEVTADAERFTRHLAGIAARLGEDEVPQHTVN